MTDAEMEAEVALRGHLADTLELSYAAQDWLMDMWHFIQVFDDYADTESVARDDRDKALWAVLVKMPSNEFYLKYNSWLLPAVAQCVMKWMASDLAEREGCADERSYMWRAGYYDLVCLVTGLEHGPSSEKAWKALSLYGESAKSYLEEFGNA